MDLNVEAIDELLSKNPMLADLPLRRAALWSTDGDVFWMQTMPLVLETYPQITVDGYWNLTVAEHAGLLPS